MGLAHDRHHRNATRTPYRLCNQLGQNILLILLRHRRDDVGERGLAGEEVFLGILAAEGVEIDIFFDGASLLRLGKVVDESVGYVGTSAHVPFVFRGQFGEFGCGKTFLLDVLVALGLCHCGHCGVVDVVAT